MPRVDFYTLQEGSHSDRFQLSCRLAAKIYSQKLKANIVCEDEEEARLMDRLLWTFRQESFIPHGMVEQTDPDLTYIFLSVQQTTEIVCDVLINLCHQTPSDFTRFTRVCEILDREPNILTSGRQRFSHYRKLGIMPEHQEIAL